MRKFIDSDGTRWEIFQVSADMLAAGRPDFLPVAFRNGWLAFDNGAERRRLVRFPAEWEALPTTALCELLQSAERVDPNRRLFHLPAKPVDQSDNPAPPGSTSIP